MAEAPRAAQRLQSTPADPSVPHAGLPACLPPHQPLLRAAAEGIGVIADPEVSATRLDRRAAFCVVATDGVWEFISSRAAVDLVGAPCLHSAVACGC